MNFILELKSLMFIAHHLSQWCQQPLQHVAVGQYDVRATFQFLGSGSCFIIRHNLVGYLRFFKAFSANPFPCSADLVYHSTAFTLS